ncbi:DEAD/DEAH box helicase [bacterium]|nr:DEAD/DEAH box helicase [bacterium]
MARAKLEIGGKDGRSVVFRGNRKYLPARIRGIVNSHFSNWNTLKDISQWPALLRELAEVNAHKTFEGTDWQALNSFYDDEMKRFSVLIHGGLEDDHPFFEVRTLVKDCAPRIRQLRTEYCNAEGRLLHNHDIWQVEKLLRRHAAKVKFSPDFIPALKVFATDAVSVEPSLSFFRQIQVYHNPQFLRPELLAIIAPHIDRVHTVADPTQLEGMIDALDKAGAKLRVDPGIADIIQHYNRLRQVASDSEYDMAVGNVLKDRLKASLYGYQREGVGFLVHNRRALLADDMGLGKTLQAMAGALYLKDVGDVRRVLIVCPSSLKYQWQSEIRKFTGERVQVIGGSKLERMALYEAATSGGGGLLGLDDTPFFSVINYELVHRDIEHLMQLNPQLLILDEAQRVKNFRTKTAQAVFSIPAANVFVLTGTPLENQLMELFTILKFVDDRALGKNPIAFRDRYVLTDQFGSIRGYQHVEEVARKIATITLRRTKEEALEDLPALVTTYARLDLTDEQKAIYRELRGEAREMLSQEAWDSTHTQNAMVLLQRLREVCDSPELIDPQYTSSQKLNELEAILEDEVGTLDRQVIIFTQWTRMGEIILRLLTKAGYSCAFLHGGLKAEERQQLVERFQRGDDRIFISTDAGGTGLNLQSASMVINYDLPFNPAKLDQRIARAHRLGQKQTVFVVNMICRNTVEERLVRILSEKKSLFDDVFGNISDPRNISGASMSPRSMRELLTELIR